MVRNCHLSPVTEYTHLLKWEKGSARSIIFQSLSFGLKLWVKEFPILFIVINMVGIAQGVLNGVIIFYTQQFYDSTENVLMKNDSLNLVYLMIAVLGLAFIAKEVLNGGHNFMYDISFTKMESIMTKIIHGK